jgi:solute carrier family 25 carnitine/acylcarnitine transporter 20/29
MLKEADQSHSGQPLDTIRVRAQIASPGQYKNTWDIASQTVKREGFLALYKGMASPLIGIASVNALLFTGIPNLRFSRSLSL